MRGLFSSLTTRGRSFMATGGAAMVCGLAIPEPDLVRVGALLVILPAVSALREPMVGPAGWPPGPSRACCGGCRPGTFVPDAAAQDSTRMGTFG